MKFFLFISVLLFSLIYIKSVFSCSVDLDCNNGRCVSSKCICKESYLTHENKTCSYKQKSKLVAFIFSFILGPFGAEWFYLANGNIFYLIVGSTKLIFGISLFLFTMMLLYATILVSITRDYNSSRKIRSIIKNFLSIICLVSLTAWYIIDWTRILIDNFPDGSNFPLQEW